MTKINFSLAWKITSLLSFLMFVFYLSFYRNNIEKKEPILKSEKPSSLIAKPKKETIHKNILNKKTADNEAQNYKIIVLKVKKNSNFYETLKKIKTPSEEILALNKVAKTYYNLSSLPAGSLLRVWQEQESLGLKKLEFDLSPSRILILEKNKSEWTSKVKELLVTKIETFFSGSIEESLWQALIDKGLTPSLANQFITILSWQIDFAREARKDNIWQVLVEKIYIEDKHTGWGKILAAEYQLKDKKITAILFKNPSDKSDYYDLQGQSIRGLFLKSPLRYSRISSRFTMNRFHPVLKLSRPHLGVDYAAPRGTPVYSVGNGRVVQVSHSRNGGKTIKIRHNSNYQTAYKHLHRWEKGIKKGKKVSQGQVIAYVGSTGLATGPHLHFEFFEKGRYIDPLGRKFPRMGSIAKEHMQSFDFLVQQYKDKLRRYALKEDNF